MNNLIFVINYMLMIYIWHTGAIDVYPETLYTYNTQTCMAYAQARINQYIILQRITNICKVIINMLT